jgi:hypothetical protein
MGMQLQVENRLATTGRKGKQATRSGTVCGHGDFEARLYLSNSQRQLSKAVKRFKKSKGKVVAKYVEFLGSLYDRKKWERCHRGHLHRVDEECIEKNRVNDL